MIDRTIRFAAPIYPGGRICLLCGNVTVGAVFPPVGNNPGRNPWVWRLFSFGANPARDGRAKDEASAKGHLLTAFAATLREAGLAPMPLPDDEFPAERPAPAGRTLNIAHSKAPRAPEGESHE